MSKLSISQQGIQIETHEKTNVMSPYHTMAFIVIGGSVALMLLSEDFWLKILGAIIFVLFILVWITIYTTHSIKKPELLQSEVYRLEVQKIESGMIENRQGNISDTNIQNSLPPNTTIYLAENIEETHEVEE